MLAPVSMLSSDFRPGLPLPHFNRHLLGAEHGDEPHRGGFTMRLGLHQQVGPAPQGCLLGATRGVVQGSGWRLSPPPGGAREGRADGGRAPQGAEQGAEPDGKALVPLAPTPVDPHGTPVCPPGPGPLPVSGPRRCSAVSVPGAPRASRRGTAAVLREPGVWLHGAPGGWPTAACPDAVQRDTDHLPAAAAIGRVAGPGGRLCLGLEAWADRRACSREPA